MCASSPSSAAPAGPASEKPDDRTTSAADAALGGLSGDRRHAGRRHRHDHEVDRFLAWPTGTARPGGRRPPRRPGSPRRLRRSSRPRPAPGAPPRRAPGSREAPTTAIDDGRMIGSSDIAAERWRSVRSPPPRGHRRPRSRGARSAPPARPPAPDPAQVAEDLAHLWLAGSTSAHSASSPSRRAWAMRRSMSPVPTPWPCHASATASDSSASGSPGRRS